MAQYRQSGFDRFLGGGGSKDYVNCNGNGVSSISSSSEYVSIGIRGPHKQHRHRKLGQKGGRRISIGGGVSVICVVLGVFALGFVLLSGDKDTTTNDVRDDEFKNDQDFLTNVTRINTSQVKSGHGSLAHGSDSRYWDGDDRTRDEEHNEYALDKSSTSHGDASVRGKHVQRKPPSSWNNGSDHHGLYNEAGRNELKMYEEKYETSLKNVGQSGKENKGGSHSSDDNEEIDIDDHYDDGIDSHDALVEDYEFAKQEDEITSQESSNDIQKAGDALQEVEHGSSNVTTVNSRPVNVTEEELNSSSKRQFASKRKGKRHKYSTASCDMKLLNSTAQLVEPLESRKFARFSLQYTKKEEKPDGTDKWEPRFAGHQSLKELEDSFIAHDQKINCGFIKGPKNYSRTGFDLAANDARYISKCHIAVVSCIFGNSDRLRSPFGRTVSRLSRKNVCFVMFMDEVTFHTISSEGQMPDRMGFIGLWKVVVVKNLPYSDLQRVGKIPKLLLHRLFPSARYSIWLDSKLRLQRDPLLILEYFLWRKGHEFAISNHYDRHCVWEEVDRNKKLNKYNHTMIDQQFAFYRADGLKRFNASDPNTLLPSNVPEGSLIIRAHTPMSNLFSCLWFNEVDRFTPRDQLSFAYTYHKLRKKNPGRPFYLHMFKDCERRQIAKSFHHRAPEISLEAAE